SALDGRYQFFDTVLTCGNVLRKARWTSGVDSVNLKRTEPTTNGTPVDSFGVHRRAVVFLERLEVLVIDAAACLGGHVRLVELGAAAVQDPTGVEKQPRVLGQQFGAVLLVVGEQNRQVGLGQGLVQVHRPRDVHTVDLPGLHMWIVVRQACALG